MNSRTSFAPQRLLQILFLAVSPACLPACVSFAQTTSSSASATQTYAEARANANKIGNELVARGIPGVAVAVAVDGHLVYAEGFGYADLEERVPVWPTTKFRIGSISKSLTATALVQLVEQGKIDLDAPVQKYVPSFPDKGAKITPRLLAGHLAGIRHYKGDEFQIAQHYNSVLDGLKIFENDPLVAPPGTGFHYSSYGYDLLSAVIESASGENFLVYMQRHVFTPLGLVDTTADQNRSIIEQRSRFYEREDDGSTDNSPYVDNSYKWAGGGFLSTPEDLVRFGSALLHPGFLAESSLRLLFTSQKTISGQETDYGMGWFIQKSETGQRIYQHSGGSVGGTSQLIIYPDTGVVVALTTNLSQGLWKMQDVEAIAEPFASR
ncbi:MAG TPA: serine hydrolase domain-containing protein [Candidatus Acidoferrum sp.]|nr:serine hydrolase domain-containing protein [Candidatus Acidoferrum sp.]